MPSKSTTERAKEDLKEGKAPSTAAGEFVHEEIEHVREGKHGARSPKQAIAIGLSKARRAGIPLKPARKGETSEKTRANAKRSYEKGQSGEGKETSSRRSRARKSALEKEPHNTASHQALSIQSREASHRRSSRDRSSAARKAARTTGGSGRRAAAKKAARTRSRSH